MGTVRFVIGYRVCVTALLAIAAVVTAAPAAMPAAGSVQIGPHRLDFSKLIYIRRPAISPSHYYTGHMDGLPKEFSGNICVLDLKTGQETELVPRLSGGLFRSFELSYDATKVVFDYKARHGEGFRIWEVRIDGTGLRQLTFPPKDEAAWIDRMKYHDQYGGRYCYFSDDMDPVYLPDGGICFVSTRPRYTILCDQPGQLTTALLHRMDADGKNMRALSNNSVSEFCPAVANDGRIIYHRWEYVDKGSIALKAIWSMNPDGTGSAEVFGNNIANPNTLMWPKPVPGSDSLYFCITCRHMGSPRGSLAIIDAQRNIRTREPVVASCGGGFEEPWPLSRDLCLVSNGRISLMDTAGKLAPLTAADKPIEGWNPVPLAPRPKPPVPAAKKNPDLAAKGLAQCIVADVYTGMEGVQRGAVKYIRINEHVPRPWGAFRYYSTRPFDRSFSEYTHLLGYRLHLGLKVQHGIVPVEADGSANFLVPAGKNIFFQALDANYCEMQRERTFVDYQPGEVVSCAGCHEQKNKLKATLNSTPLAVRREPSVPGPQPGEATGRRPLHFPADVQPVLDKHCVSCHKSFADDGGPDGLGVNHRVIYHNAFSPSYVALMKSGWCGKTIDEEDSDDSGYLQYLPPYSLGARKTKLLEVLMRGDRNHKPWGQMGMTRGELTKIVTWLDSQCQFYGTYFGRKPLSQKGQPDYRPTPTFESATRREPPYWVK